MFNYGFAMPSQLDNDEIAIPGAELRRILVTDRFEELWHEVNRETLHKQVNEKQFTVKDGDITYRVINHWTAQGLLDDGREDSSNWRKLSLKDLLWLRILRELRRFGLPLETLRIAFNSLNYVDDRPSYNLEAAIGMCLKREPVFAIVFNDGHTELAAPDCLQFTDAIVGYQPYIRINLNLLWCEILGKNNYRPKPPSLSELTNAEMDAINAMRDESHDTVQVSLKQGDIMRIDTSKKVDGAQRIVDLLQETEFGEITMKVENGKAVHTQVVKKEKPRK